MDGFKTLPRYKAGGLIKTPVTGEKKAAAPSKGVAKPAFKGSDVAKEKSKPAGHKDPYIKSGESRKTPNTPSAAVKGRNKKVAGTVKKYANGSFVEKGVDALKSVGTDLKNKIIGTPEQNKTAQANLDKQAQSGSKLASFLGGKKKGGSIRKCAAGGSIDDDVRARAMKWIASGSPENKDDAETPSKPAKKVATKLYLPDYTNEDLDRMDAEEADSERKRESQALFNKKPVDTVSKADPEKVRKAYVESAKYVKSPRTFKRGGKSC